MTEAHDIARNAAQRLAVQYGKDLPMAVEKAILGAAPEQFGMIGDAANVAMAIAAYAALAWAIWHDVQSDKKPEPEAIHRELRLKLPATKGLDAATRDRIIVIVVDEAVKK